MAFLLTKQILAYIAVVLSLIFQRKNMDSDIQLDKTPGYARYIHSRNTPPTIGQWTQHNKRTIAQN